MQIYEYKFGYPTSVCRGLLLFESLHTTNQHPHHCHHEIRCKTWLPSINIALPSLLTATTDQTDLKPAILVAALASLSTLGQAAPTQDPAETGHDLEARQNPYRSIACYPYRGSTPYYAPIPGYEAFVSKIPNRDLVVANGPYGYQTTLKTVDGSYSACATVEYSCLLCGSGAGVATGPQIRQMLNAGFAQCVKSGSNTVRGIWGLAENTYFYDFSVSNDNFTVFATGKPCPGSPGVPGTLFKIA